MGGGTWTRSDYATKSATYQTKTRAQLFSNRISKDFDPKNITIRESCDSADNPNSTAVIIGLDVTGSMGFIAEHIAKKSLGTLVESIHDRKPVSDPHIMMMAIGDIQHDNHPLQATQFEADIRIADQLTELYLEGGGGGNSYESYDLPWIFAANKTKIDCFEKRGVKGYLFTIGDELPPRTASYQRLNEEINTQFQSELTQGQALIEAQEKYNVFHVIVEEGWYCSSSNRKDEVVSKWRDLLGKRAIVLNDHKYISEVITSVMQVSEGEDPETVIAQWQDQAAKDAVRYSLFN